MAPREGDRPSSALSNIKLTAYKKFPTNYPHLTPDQWLRAKKIDDNVGPYWRVHNKLYDLTDFIDRHPGGMWVFFVCFINSSLFSVHLIPVLNGIDDFDSYSPPGLSHPLLKAVLLLNPPLRCSLSTSLFLYAAISLSLFICLISFLHVDVPVQSFPYLLQLIDMAIPVYISSHTHKKKLEMFLSARPYIFDAVTPLAASLSPRTRHMILLCLVHR